MRPIELKSEKGGVLLGRHERCNVHLPLESVSRFHARIDFESFQWRLTDLKSRWGTFLNGQRVVSDTSIPLKHGDLIGIAPWTFNFGVKQPDDRGIASMDDVAEADDGANAGDPSRHARWPKDDSHCCWRLSSSLQNVTDEQQRLAEVLMEAAKRRNRK